MDVSTDYPNIVQALEYHTLMFRLTSCRSPLYPLSQSSAEITPGTGMGPLLVTPPVTISISASPRIRVTGKCKNCLCSSLLRLLVRLGSSIHYKYHELDDKAQIDFGKQCGYTCAKKSWRLQYTTPLLIFETTQNRE